MVIKAVSLFLIGMLLLAMFGRFRVQKKPGRKGPAKKTLEARKCPKCGSYVLGDGTCPCNKTAK
ncbi:MAG: hypothetical protein Q9M41_09800 [Paracoccaceae bacterium]|nr:hypothetical protein [Paracoccaceae bacterium]